MTARTNILDTMKPSVFALLACLGASNLQADQFAFPFSNNQGRQHLQNFTRSDPT